MKNLFAHTDPTGPGYPAYVSLNVQDDGSVTLDVRTAGEPDASRIVLTQAQAHALADGLDNV